MKPLILLSVCTAILILGACSQRSVPAKKSDARNMNTACANLVSSTDHANFSIASSQSISKTGNLPGFCQITGEIKPSIGFEARFPLTDWNGKYYQAGCGGFCGVVEPNRETQSNAINHALRRGYATMTTDAGHKGQHLGDGSWALNNPAAELVYAHKTLPLTLQAGHQLIDMLYNDAPKYSYFSGCSNGGRMAAIAAQRYADLFDGIISGCPVLNLSVNGGVFGAWVLQAMTDSQGDKILGPKFTPKLAMLEENSLKQCDAIDGEADRIISEPFTCKVDLDSIPICSGSSQTTCLTPTERRAVQKWYDGPTNSEGVQLFPGMAPGSERYWGYWYLGTDKGPGPGTLLADGYGKYLGFPEDPKDYDALDFNLDTDIPKLAEQGKLYNALDPDLSAFKKAGGKMIMWHGMSDPLVLPNQSPQYYEAVKAAMGQEGDVPSFYRLFMAPGLGHCWEKPANAPDHMNMLEALENWVESDIAPDTIELTQYDNSKRVFRKGLLRPYPLTAIYEPQNQ